MYSCPQLEEGGNYITLWILSHKHQTNILCNQSLGILGMDLASFHHPNQYLIKLASKLTCILWQWSQSHTVESIISLSSRVSSLIVEIIHFQVRFISRCFIFFKDICDCECVHESLFCSFVIDIQKLFLFVDSVSWLISEFVYYLQTFSHRIFGISNVRIIPSAN